MVFTSRCGLGLLRRRRRDWRRMGSLPIILDDLSPICSLLVDVATVLSGVASLASHFSFRTRSSDIHVGCAGKVLPRSWDVSVLWIVGHLKARKWNPRRQARMWKSGVPGTVAVYHVAVSG